MSRPRIALVLAACAAAFALPACGGDDEREAGAQPAGATATPTPDERPAYSY
jgi:hypothetical protein